MREAASKAREALTLLSRESEPRLYLWAQHNLALYLAEQGQYIEAAELLAINRDLYLVHSAPMNTLHLAWLSGRISAGLGRLAEAESSFLAAREGFLAQGIAYDGALVSLDLALLYLQQQRTEEVKGLAMAMVGVFESQGVHREAFAACLLFREAAQQDGITRDFVERLARYLEAAKADPDLAFAAR